MLEKNSIWIKGERISQDLYWPKKVLEQGLNINLEFRCNPCIREMWLVFEARKQAKNVSNAIIHNVNDAMDYESENINIGIDNTF